MIMMQAISNRQLLSTFGETTMTDRLQRAPLMCHVPFCEPSCDGDHHALLKCLCRCSFEPGNSREEEILTLGRLEDAISRAQNDGWKLSDDVPEKIRKYFPLVHWAAILGKGTALKRLVENGFLPDVVAHRVGSTTALHSAVLYLYRTYSRCGLRSQALAAFQKVAVILFRSTIHMADVHGCTPFNRACEELGKAIESVHVDYYSGVVHCLLKLMMEQLSSEQRCLILNHGDSASYNTPLHLLAKHDFTLSTVSALLEAGADPTQRNRVGLTACELAQNHGAHSVARRLFNAVPQNSMARMSPKPALGVERSELPQLHGRQHVGTMHNGRPEVATATHVSHSSSPVSTSKFDVGKTTGEPSVPKGYSFTSQSPLHLQAREHALTSASQRKQPQSVSVRQNEVHFVEGSKPVVASFAWANSPCPPVSTQQGSSVRQLMNLQQPQIRRPLLPRPVQPQDDQQQGRTTMQDSPISVLGKPIPLRDVCAIPIYTLPNPSCPDAFEAAWSTLSSSLKVGSRDDQSAEGMQVSLGSKENEASCPPAMTGLAGHTSSSPKRSLKPELDVQRKVGGETTSSTRMVSCSSLISDDAPRSKSQVSLLPPPPPLLKMPPATPGSVVLASKALSVEETRLPSSIPEQMAISSGEMLEEKLLKLVCGNDSFMACLNAIETSVSQETRDFLIRDEQQRRYNDWQAASSQHKEALTAEAELQHELAEAKRQVSSTQNRLEARKKELERLQQELSERSRRLEHLRQRRITIDNRHQLAQLKSAACEHALTALPIVYERHVTLGDDDPSEFVEQMQEAALSQLAAATRTASGTSNYDSASVSSTPVVPNRSLADIALGSPGVGSHIAVS